MKQTLLLDRAAVIVLVALLAVGCSDNATQPGEPVARVDVAPTAPSLTVGGTVQLSATVRDRNNQELPDRPVSWSSDRAAIATVSSAGLVTARDVGTAIITAASGGKQATATVTVTGSQTPIASITLDRTSATLAEGDQTQFIATPRDAEGKPLQGRSLTWTSSDPSVATVTATGVVTAIRAQTTTVAVNGEGKTATAAVRVTADYPYELVHSGWSDPFAAARLYTLRLGDGSSRPLLPPDVLPDVAFGQPAVSPDGRRIAMAGYDGTADANYIFVVNADGSDLKQLTAGGYETQPAWSPDGAKIAYVVRPRGGEGDIWVMNADGTDAVNLTGGMNSLNQYSPAWSGDLPGGVRIAFGEGNASYSNLWTMRPDGTDRQRVTSGTSWWDDDPSWSPDGTKLVFSREGPGTEGYDIWVIDVTGANAKSLVKLPFGQGYPEFSPDGRLVVFNSSHDEDPANWFVIYTVWSDGTKLARRTFDPPFSIRPAWRRR